MALLKYIRKANEALPDKQTCPSLTEKDLKAANERVKKCLECEPDSREGQPHTPTKRGKYNDYTPEQRAQIGKYAAENGPTRAAKHFSQLLKRSIP